MEDRVSLGMFQEPARPWPVGIYVPRGLLDNQAIRNPIKFQVVVTSSEPSTKQSEGKGEGK